MLLYMYSVWRLNHVQLFLYSVLRLQLLVLVLFHRAWQLLHCFIVAISWTTIANSFCSASLSRVTIFTSCLSAGTSWVPYVSSFIIYCVIISCQPYDTISFFGVASNVTIVITCLRVATSCAIIKCFETQ